MIELFSAVAGIGFGALGAFLALKQHVNTVQIEAARKLQERIDQESENKVKSYAAEREFLHIKRQYEQMSQMLLNIDTDVENLKTSFVELKGQITAYMLRNNKEN